MAKIGEFKVVRGKRRRLYAIAKTARDTTRAKARLLSAGYKGIVIEKRKGYELIWAIRP